MRRSGQKFGFQPEACERCATVEERLLKHGLGRRWNAVLKRLWDCSAFGC
jgi:hypothetical protein